RRRAAQRAPAARATKRPATRERSRPADGRRAPSIVRKELKEAERELERLQRRHDQLVAEVGAGTTDHAELARLGAELAEVDERRRQVEDRWLALAEEAEST
ncbi:MAG TPA: ABC transporter C-terminal domain-containing protein, partial [Acidimicrobiales bacterium]|nr:ABC transporter C-terminal domain-containing protein [Acidimicrobiales bacterium]